MSWVLSLLAFAGAYLWVQHGRKAWVDPAGAPFWLSGSSYTQLYAEREIPKPVRLVISLRRFMGGVEIALGACAAGVGLYSVIAGMASWPPAAVCALTAILTCAGIHLYVVLRHEANREP